MIVAFLGQFLTLFCSKRNVLILALLGGENRDIGPIARGFIYKASRDAAKDGQGPGLLSSEE